MMSANPEEAMHAANAHEARELSIVAPEDNLPPQENKAEEETKVIPISRARSHEKQDTPGPSLPEHADIEWMIENHNFD